MHPTYRAQVDLLLRILPFVAEEEDLALKGGTAINMFVWDMPRLSVDIDLTYLPFDDRKTALTNISNAIVRIKNKTIKAIPNIQVKALGTGEDQQEKLLCTMQGVQVKIEINTVMRGIIKPAQVMPVTNAVQKEFGKFADIKVISYGELFGGKICAALDRQHPRDLFDVSHLLEESINEEVKEGFIAALLSHNRSIHEMLSPNFSDQTKAFDNQFAGMTLRPFSYADFEKTRKKLLSELHKILTDNDKQLLLGFKAGEPNWDLSNIEQLKNLPAVKWKLANIRKLKQENPKKHVSLLNKLRGVLG